MKFGVFKLKGSYIAFIVASFSFRVGLVYRETRGQGLVACLVGDMVLTI